MTARHTHASRRGSGRSILSARAVRLLGALLALLCTVITPPVVLLLAAGSPLDPPAALRSRDVLTSQVDDRTLLWVLAVCAWLVYTHLVACLLVEVLRQTRGSTLQVPLRGLLFGANTTLAAHLIAGLLLTGHPASTGGTIVEPALLHSALTTPILTATAPSHEPVPTMVSRDALRQPSTQVALPIGKASGGLQCRVLPPDGRDHDTLWDIAERHLGDGMRWREVFALNENRLMPDGQRLTKASLIHPGWILTLPPDAISIDIDRVTSSPSTELASVAPTAPASPTAQPGDPHEPQPDTAASGAEKSSTLHDTNQRTDGTPAARAAPEVPAAQVPAVPEMGSSEQRSPSRPASGQDAAVDSTDDHRDGMDAVAPAALGALALASLGLLGALTRRRKVAARRRPVGIRTQRPGPELLAQEQQIRRDARLAETTAATVRLALLLAGKHNIGTDLKALWQHPDGSVEVCWTEPAAALPAPTPFQTTDTGWLLPADAQRLLYATRQAPAAALGDVVDQDHADATDTAHRPREPRDADGFDPVPLLTPIGHRNGSALLVNLELYGAITLHHDQPMSSLPLEVLTAWIQALASAPWASAVHTHVPTDLADLATGFDRISATDQVQPPVTLQAQEAAEIAQLGSVAAARRANPDLHQEDLTLYAGHQSDAIPAGLLTAAAGRQLPVTFLLLDDAGDADQWVLNVQGLLTIPGLASDVTPLRVDRDTHQRILRLLEHAQDPPHANPDDPALAELRAQCPPDPTALDEDPAEQVDPADPDVIDLTAQDDNHDADGGQGSHGTEEGPPSELVPADATVEPDDAGRKSGAATGSSAPPRTNTGPIEVSILGPITVSGLDADPPRRVTLDLLIYYAFHRRPISSRELWDGLWPNKPYQDTTLRGRRSELNRLIHPLLRKVGQRHYLDDLVHTDWQRFQALAEGNSEQQLAALKLIRGRPFDNCQLDWMHLEGQITEIEAAITDLAIEVAQRALTRNDYATARAAAHAGMLGTPFDERLYRLGMQAAAADGATGEVHQLRRQLNIVIQDELDPDDEMQPATVELLKHLADQERTAQLRDQRPRP